MTCITQTTGTRESNGKIGDYGFRTDTKLIYTAITKARFMNIVIGDPADLIKPARFIVLKGEDKRVCTDSRYTEVI